MTDSLFKVEGAGNDFILGVGTWADRLAHRPEIVAHLCHRRHGVGGDGALALSPLEAGRVRLTYRNADGRKAAFCANGTRCAARAAVDLLGQPARLIVETDWTSVPAAVKGSTVTLDLPSPSVVPDPPEIVVVKPVLDFRLLEVGVPHLVAEVRGLAEIDMATHAAPLRRHPGLGPEGANVHFFEVADDGTLAVRSWERGVEGETLCCGSGVVAVALIEMDRGGGRRLEVVPRSGARLEVVALGQPPNCPTQLIGPARMVAEVIPARELLERV